MLTNAPATGLSLQRINWGEVQIYRKKDLYVDVATALKAMSPPPKAKPSTLLKAKP